MAATNDINFSKKKVQISILPKNIFIICIKVLKVKRKSKLTLSSEKIKIPILGIFIFILGIVALNFGIVIICMDLVVELLTTHKDVKDPTKTKYVLTGSTKRCA